MRCAPLRSAGRVRANELPFESEYERGHLMGMRSFGYDLSRYLRYRGDPGRCGSFPCLKRTCSSKKLSQASASFFSTSWAMSEGSRLWSFLLAMRVREGAQRSVPRNAPALDKLLPAPVVRDVPEPVNPLGNHIEDLVGRPDPLQPNCVCSHCHESMILRIRVGPESGFYPEASRKFGSPYTPRTALPPRPERRGFRAGERVIAGASRYAATGK